MVLLWRIVVGLHNYDFSTKQVRDASAGVSLEEIQRRVFCAVCILVSLSLVPRQGLSLDFPCLSIYSLAISPELFVCLSIYENAETCPRSQSSHGCGGILVT